MEHMPAVQSCLHGPSIRAENVLKQTNLSARNQQVALPIEPAAGKRYYVVLWPGLK